MKLIFPTNEDDGLQSTRSGHFGKANFYTIIDLDEQNKVKDTKSVKNNGHDNGSCGSAVQNILKLNPDALIVGGIGKRPAMGFEQANIKVFIDKNSKNVEKSLELYFKNELPTLNGIGTCGSK